MRNYLFITYICEIINRSFKKIFYNVSKSHYYH